MTLLVRVDLLLPPTPPPCVCAWGGCFVFKMGFLEHTVSIGLELSRGLPASASRVLGLKAAPHMAIIYFFRIA